MEVALAPDNLAIRQTALTEKLEEEIVTNPVIESAKFAYQKINIVRVKDDSVKSVARHIYDKILLESYTPHVWRTHPLHLCPPEPYDPASPLTKAALNWIFLISSLNFSFWSARDPEDCYAVEWRAGWDSDEKTAWTGYWSLLAAINRALEEDIPIIDPAFYSSETLCPDSLLEHIFRPASQSGEGIALLRERIAIMREVGFILCTSFGGSFQGFIEEFHRRHDRQGTALKLVRMITDTFPSFQDEVWLEGRRVFIWKRAQILVAETWAAFYPSTQSSPHATSPVHPLFPGPLGPSIHQLTMFADYRVPQILHHLRVLMYPPALVRKLRQGVPLEPGAPEEVSIRTASILAVEKMREEMASIGGEGVSSVLIDFYLWDLGKRIENGEEKIEGIETGDIVPVHRTRSIWY